MPLVMTTLNACITTTHTQTVMCGDMRDTDNMRCVPTVQSVDREGVDR